MTQATDFDVIIIGAGAAGLMCAITAGGRGKKILIIDHAEKIGEKIRISGGGRCNFTNIGSTPRNFLSQNPRFCISALKRYRPQNIIDLVERHEISWHDKGAGQLFCDGSATQIITMLLQECHSAGAKIWKETTVSSVEKAENIFYLVTSKGPVCSAKLVIASGGLSIPKIGASSFGHTLATQFGHTVIPHKPGLVPLTFSGTLLEKMNSLTGMAVNAKVQCEKTSFNEALLFTHRGLSGPAILQISSYWREGLPITIDLMPDKNMFDVLSNLRSSKGKQLISNVLSGHMPSRLAEFVCARSGIAGRLADLTNKSLKKICDAIHKWEVLPQGTEGYRTAEVTLGGVDTSEISSKTMQSNKVSNLYFVGEVVDVTGHLGGHNFQWAWASGHAAGVAL